MELDIIRGVQSISNGFWDGFFQTVTQMGEEVFILLVLLLVYYVIDKKHGEQLAFITFCSLLCNTFLKDLLQFPRPIGEPGVRSIRIETAGGSSMPSGHTQTFTTVAYSLARLKNTSYGYLIALSLCGLVGLSRLYLGVHYPKDVLVGFMLGILIPMLIYKILAKIKKPIYLYAGAVLFFTFGLLLDNSPTYIQLYGFLMAFLLGVYLENKYVNFTTKLPLPKRLLRLTGGIIIAALWVFAGKYLPDGLIFIFLEYFCLSLTLIFIYPWFFTKCKF